MTTPGRGAGKPDPRSAAEKLEAQIEARERRAEKQREAARQRELEEERKRREAAEEKARRKAEAKAKADARAAEAKVLSAVSFPRRLLRAGKVANLVLAIAICLFLLWQTVSAASVVGELPAGTGLRLAFATALQITLVLFFCAVLHLVLTGIGAVLDIRDGLADAVEQAVRGKGKESSCGDAVPRGPGGENAR